MYQLQASQLNLGLLFLSVTFYYYFMPCSKFFTGKLSQLAEEYN